MVSVYIHLAFNMRTNIDLLSYNEGRMEYICRKSKLPQNLYMCYIRIPASTVGNSWNTFLLLHNPGSKLK